MARGNFHIQLRNWVEVEVLVEVMVEVLIAECSGRRWFELWSPLPSSFSRDHQYLELTASSRSSRSVSCPSISPSIMANFLPPHATPAIHRHAGAPLVTSPCPC